MSGHTPWRDIKHKNARGDALAKAVEAVLEKVDECPADECGVNLILDILRPAFNDYVADVEARRSSTGIHIPNNIIEKGK